jgi:orotate phosphoribosyltransferase
MSPAKARLLELIRERAYRHGDFTLASGKKSDTYIDGKMVQFHPESAYLLGECLFELLADQEFDAIGGLAVGAVPLVTSFAISCHRHERPVEGFFVREKKKDHGTEQKIEGRFKAPCRAVILDDVVTEGGSSLKAVAAAEEAGASIVMVVAVVDRQEGGGDKIREKYPFRALFTKGDLAGK